MFQSVRKCSFLWLKTWTPEMRNENILGWGKVLWREVPLVMYSASKTPLALEFSWVVHTALTQHQFLGLPVTVFILTSPSTRVSLLWTLWLLMRKLQLQSTLANSNIFFRGKRCLERESLVLATIKPQTVLADGTWHSYSFCKLKWQQVLSECEISFSSGGWLCSVSAHTEQPGSSGLHAELEKHPWEGSRKLPLGILCAAALSPCQGWAHTLWMVIHSTSSKAKQSSWGRAGEAV